LRLQHVLVKGTDQNEDPISSSLQCLDGAPEGLPLQGSVQIDPGKILFGDSTFVPRNRRMPKGVIRWRQGFFKRLRGVFIGMLQSPARDIAPIIISRLKMAGPAIERKTLLDEHADAG